MTGVREMAFRDLYRGRLVYGKTAWEYGKGRKYKVAVPESEWITLEQPALRIVPEPLWQAAHARLDRTRQAYLRQTGGKLWGRPETGIEAKYLLSGFATCGVCGSGMHAIRRTGRRMEPKIYFTCHGWRVDGCCTNNMSISLADIDQAVLRPRRKLVPFWCSENRSSGCIDSRS
jgi:site-specific DNA recombinase